MKFQKASQLTDGTIIHIFSADALGSSKAASIALRSYADMIDNGHNLGYHIAIDNNTPVIWAQVDNTPIGGMCYVLKEEISTCWISLSFTHSDWRGRGLNKACRLVLEDLMREREIKYMASFVSSKNERMLHIVKEAGFEAAFYRMHKKL